MDTALPPYVPPIDVALDDFPRNEALPAGCVELGGLVDDDSYQAECRELTYVTRVLADGSPCPRKLYALIPSSKDPIKASYGADGFPCVVFVQGSAWHAQHLYAHFSDHVRLCSHGFIVVCVQYRESDLAPFPAQMQDAKTAVRFVRAHAQELHVDPTRMALWGDSSGAHTALLAAFTAGMDNLTITAEDRLIELDTPDCGEESAEVTCVVDWYGPTALELMNTVPSCQDHNGPGSPEGMVLGGVTVREHLELAAAASPLSYIPPVGERALPPVLIMHGGRDQLVNFDQSVRLYEALRTAGQDVTFYKLPDAHHGSNGFRCAGALDVVESFLHKHLA